MLVEAQDEHEVGLEGIIDGVEDAGEGDIADQRNFKACKEPARSLLCYYLSKSVSDACILGEANDFETRFDYYQRV